MCTEIDSLIAREGGRATVYGQYLGGGPVNLKVDELFKLLEAQGHKSYEKKSEGVTQLVSFIWGTETRQSTDTAQEHALQAGELARSSGKILPVLGSAGIIDRRYTGADDATVVAALLHDIGHYIPHPTAVQMFEQGQAVGRRSHDAIGETYLAQLGFPRSVTALVGGHVDAKRYLTATVPTYMDTLSLGSQRSLKHQVCDSTLSSYPRLT